MPKTQIVSEKIRQPSGHFSQVISIETRGRLVFISGMTARCADGSIAGIGDIEAQTRQVCENIKSAVEQAGGTMDDICRVDWSTSIAFTKCDANTSSRPRRLRPWSKSAK
jgi:2-iminobutanoate/2-iminopropanoate deaminase